MEFSLFFFADDSITRTAGAAGRYDLLLEAARFGDAHGFTAVWTPERHFHAFGGLYPNPSVTGAAVAAVTERIAVRAGSVVAPLQDPLRIVEEWSVVDNVSGGRCGISFGSGWHQVDFVLAPENYDDRQARTMDTIDTVRRLWRGEPVERRTATGEPAWVRTYPPPVRPDLPVWLTSAGSPATFRAAGQAGTAVLTHLVKTGRPVLGRNIEMYREAFRPSGPAIPRPHVTLMLHTLIDPGEGSRELVRDALRRYVLGSASLFGSSAGPSGGRVTSPAQIDRLADVSVQRYLTSAGLFGPVEQALVTVGELAALGIDEIACLVDFGLPPDIVLAGLEQLDDLRRSAAAPPATIR